MILSYKNRKTKQTLIIPLIVFFLYVSYLSLSYSLNEKNVFIDPLIETEHKKILSKMYESKRFLSNSYPTTVPKKYSVLICSSQKINDSSPLFINDGCYWYSKSLTYTEIEELSKKDIVKSIMLNKPKKPMLSYAIPFAFGNRTYINGFPHNILTSNNKQLNGSKVRISIIDTGINDTNPWFDDAKIIYKASVHYFQSNNTCVFNTSQTAYFDYNSHGTHVISIAHSIAPSSEIISLKPSNFRDDEIICAIEKALELNSSIISMSLGGIYHLSDCSNAFDMLCSYIDSLVSSNPEIIFTVAAGNEGYWPWHYGNYNKEVSVSINYLNNPDALNYCGNINELYFNIIWYDTSKRISSVEIINQSNNAILGEVLYDTALSNYVINTYDITYLSGGFNCSINQCFLILNFNTPYDVILRINSSFLEWDFYDWLYFLGPINYNPCYNYYPPKRISPSNNNRTITTPGISSNVLTVGSATSYLYSSSYSSIGDVSFFSSRGNVKINSSYEILKPELIAPGEQILAASNTAINTTKSGTSMATPFMAGVVALIKQILPTLTINELKQNLSSISLSNAYNLANFYQNEKGYGLTNLSSLIYALPKIENVKAETINIYSESNVSNITINFSVRGVLRAKIDGKKYYPKKNYSLNLTINTSSIKNAGNYTLNYILEGEFSNSPLMIPIKTVAYSNVSNITLVEYKIINSSYVNISLRISNNGLNASCEITEGKTKYIVEINKTTQIQKVFSTEFGAVMYLNISINCPNNAGIRNTTLKLYGINISSPEKAYLFENLSINITPYGNISDAKQYYVVVNEKLVKNVAYSNDSKIINISTLSIYRNFTEKYNLSIVLETNTKNITLLNKTISIITPLEVNFSYLNTLNTSILGLNTTINLSVKPLLNRTFYLLININTTRKNITINETKLINLNPYINRSDKDIEKRNLVVMVIDTEWIVLKNITVYIDAKPPYININQSYNFQKILIPLEISEKNLHFGKIIINSSVFNITSNVTMIEIDTCINTTGNITITDKGNNTIKTKLNITCMYINNSIFNKYLDSIFTNISSLPINISDVTKEYNKIESSTKITEIIREKINITPNKNAFALIKLKFTIPSGYTLNNAIIDKVTSSWSIKNITTIKGSYAYILLNLTSDPLIILEYIKETTKSSSSSSTSSIDSGNNGVGIMSISNTNENKQKLSSEIEVENKTNEIYIKVKGNKTYHLRINFSIINISITFSKNNTKYEGTIKILKETNKIAFYLNNVLLTITEISINPEYNIMCKENRLKLCSIPLNINKNYFEARLIKKSPPKKPLENKSIKQTNETSQKENNNSNITEYNTKIVILIVLILIVLVIGSIIYKIKNKGGS